MAGASSALHQRPALTVLDLPAGQADEHGLPALPARALPAARHIGDHGVGGVGGRHARRLVADGGTDGVGVLVHLVTVTVILNGPRGAWRFSLQSRVLHYIHPLHCIWM